MMNLRKLPYLLTIAASALVIFATSSLSAAEVANSASSPDHLIFEGTEGPGKGKHVVLLAGDEEYRSEEAMPMMAQILARQGFKTTVLFSLDEKGNVNPDAGEHLSNPEAMDSADAVVMSLRFRHWQDEAMEKFEAALNRGTPIIALRTSTHAFNFPKDSKWARYSFNASEESGWHKGFGRQVLGETWVSHHGKHKVEGSRSHVEEANADHPILNSVGTCFVTEDVYGANPLEPSTILQRGAVTETLDPDSAEVAAKNDPMQPLTWIREFKNEAGNTNKIFTTTMGASTGLLDEDLRRLVVNAVYWGLDMEVPEKADATLPEGYLPSAFSFAAYRLNLKPENFIPGDPKFKEAPFGTRAPKQKGKAKENKYAVPKGDDKRAKLEVKEGDTIVMIGAGMASRMVHFGHFETELFMRFPAKDLTIRNMGDEGNTPAFRPHPGRGYEDQYAFPGAKALMPKDLQTDSKPNGHFETPDQWLTRLGADTVIAFFGFNSSFGGPEDLERYKQELDAFLKHTLAQKYNNKSVPQVALVSPTAYQDLSSKYNVPSGEAENKNLKLYTDASAEVAAANNVVFVDAFALSQEIYKDGEEYTRDGALLNDLGYQKLAPALADGLFGPGKVDENSRSGIRAAVMEKNWAWMNDFKIANGVHVYGRRYNPFGPDNYPYELEKTREMTVIRDQSIWATLKGENFDMVAADAQTLTLPPVETNYKPSEKNGVVDYASGKVAETKIKVPEGYKIELFASEEDFPNLANPVSLAFDNKGRLWVATMASYPHYRIGDPLPEDKLLIYEDTDGDGKADKETVFAGDLHIPIGFEINHDGVYVSQSSSLVLLKDVNGDDSYDIKEVLLSGFDDHDTHHAISAFCADPSGAIMMGEGIFLHTNVESAYGTHRGTNGGFFRYSPQQKKLTRHAQYKIPNPWGIAFDDYGQDFFLHTSGTKFSWMLPGSVKPVYGVNMEAPDLITSNNVRPTSGVEFISSRHFPEDVQGDVLINNNIGYLGAKQHKVMEDGTGFATEYRQDLFVSEDLNFRPVDLEFAPDGSLYIVDWQNALIGHMQHSARDPLRDHEHGRIYRMTHPGRPLVEPAKVDGASIAELLENLKLHEYRTRYRTRRELRGRDAAEVVPAAVAWAAKQSDDRHKLEALWVTWGADNVDVALLEELLQSEDHKIRSAAVRVLRYQPQLGKQHELLMTAARDSHGRVRMEAVAAGSRGDQEQGLAILAAAEAKGVDKISEATFKTAKAALSGEILGSEGSLRVQAPKHLENDRKAAQAYAKGAEIYGREAHCGTCHQSNGMGLPAAGFPPLKETKWATGDPERLIKLSLKGLFGPIEVNGQTYPGVVPMTPFEHILKDDELAAVLTYVRNSWGNKASAITPQEVAKVRKEIKNVTGMYNPADLLKEHPYER